VKYNKNMTVKEKSKLLALVISIIYVGIGSVKLISIIVDDGMVFNGLGETFDKIIMPSYIIGFGLGYGGGSFFAFLGQLIVFGLVYGIMYVFSLFIFKIIEINHSKK
jgi:hypothetical protein